MGSWGCEAMGLWGYEIPHLPGVEGVDPTGHPPGVESVEPTGHPPGVESVDPASRPPVANCEFQIADFRFHRPPE